MEWEYSIAPSGEPPEPAPVFDAEATIARYRDAAISLLPPGRAISKRISSGIGELLEGLSVEFARVHEAALIFYRNIDPSKAIENLELWEEALGLPGPCVTTPTEDTAERQGAILTKLRGRKTHSQADFEAAALALGYDDVEFEHFAPFETGVSSVGDAIYDDGWMHAVRITVAVGDQTADDQLVCTFNELRRSHGALEIILEGPMGAARTHTANYFNNHVLSADMVVADLAAVEIKYSGYLSIQCRIDNGAGAAPSDSPVGVWELWVSSDGTTFTQWTTAALVTELDRVNPDGNNLVEAVATVEGVPGRYVKVRYNSTSGGAGNSRATMHLTTW